MLLYVSRNNLFQFHNSDVTEHVSISRQRKALQAVYAHVYYVLAYRNNETTTMHSDAAMTEMPEKCL
jgi:hypothetical protein